MWLQLVHWATQTLNYTRGTQHLGHHDAQEADRGEQLSAWNPIRSGRINRQHIKHFAGIWFANSDN